VLNPDAEDDGWLLHTSPGVPTTTRHLAPLPRMKTRWCPQCPSRSLVSRRRNDDHSASEPSSVSVGRSLPGRHAGARSRHMTQPDTQTTACASPNWPTSSNEPLRGPPSTLMAPRHSPSSQSAQSERPDAPALVGVTGEPVRQRSYGHASRPWLRGGSHNGASRSTSRLTSVIVFGYVLLGEVGAHSGPE